MRRFLPLMLTLLLWPLTAVAQPPAVPAPPSKAALLNADLFLAITDHRLADVKAALDAGADPNGRDWLSFTPLLNACFMGDLDAAKLLLRHGARINDDSTYGSALTQAALGRNDQIGLFLLDRGAKPNPPRFDKTSPLMVAAETGSLGMLRRLLKLGVDPNQKNDDGATALTFAARASRPDAVALLLTNGARVKTVDGIKRTPLHYAALNGSSGIVELLIARHAPVNAVDAAGFTPIQLAARYAGDAATVRLLLRAGADATKRDGRGKTPYEIAVRRGYDSVAALLKPSGGAVAAKVGVASVTTVGSPSGPASAAAAVTPALASLQRGMRAFQAKAACVGCHHQGLGLMAIGRAAQHRLPVDGKLIGAYMDRLGEDGKSTAGLVHAAALDAGLTKLIPAVDIEDFASGSGYFFNAALAAGAPPNPGFADASVVVGGLQKPDGSWQVGMHRGAMEQSYFTTTAMVLEALDAYWPAEKRADWEARQATARAWLTSAKPRCAEDLAARMWGLKAAGADDQAIAAAARELLAAQRADGGWGFAGASRSNAHTTGFCLYLLRTAGGIQADSPAVRRAVAFLIRTQDEDGTWYVPKITPAYNNHFDASFPQGYSQFASFAGTCWATMGLMETLETQSAMR